MEEILFIVANKPSYCIEPSPMRQYTYATNLYTSVSIKTHNFL